MTPSPPTVRIGIIICDSGKVTRISRTLGEVLREFGTQGRVDGGEKVHGDGVIGDDCRWGPDGGICR